MFDGRWRTGVDRVTAPIGASLRHSGLSADHFTAAGLVLAACTAVAVGSGRITLGLVLLVLTALPDMLDGAVAKATGTASPRGAFFDSVADRVSDSLVLGGIAWYLAGEGGGHGAMLPFAVLAVSTLVSYQRAKAESLGYAAKGGLMERAERIIALCVGLAFPVALVPVLWLMLVLTGVTAVQRFVKVWRQASTSRPPRPVGAARAAGERPWRPAVADWRRRRQERAAGARAWRRSRRAGTRP